MIFRLLLCGWLAIVTMSRAETEAPPAEAAEEETGKEANDATVRELVQAHFKSVVLVEGNEGSGTGFVVKADGKTWVYTAAHVFCGNTRLELKTTEGRVLRKFGQFQAATDADLVRVELLEDFDTDVAIAPIGSVEVKDPILAIGNSGGAGVLTVLDGKVVSLGPDQVEVSAGVIQGNSGGPIFSGRNGMAIGVVTHLVAAREDLWAQDTEFSEVRRFATRLDREVAWDDMPIGRFLQENGRLEAYNRNTQVMYAISALNPGQAGLRLNVRISENGPTLMSIFNENEENPVVEELIDMNSKLGDRGFRTSESDLRKRFGRFYFTAMSQLDKDHGAVQPGTFSGFNRKSAENAVRWRADALKTLKRAADRLN